MKVIPQNSKLQIEIDQPKVGALDISSKKTAVEHGTVVAVGKDVQDFKPGDKIFFKAWGLDVISYEGKDYFFIDSTSEGICAKYDVEA